ncbi:transcriptional regulator, AraC family [Aquipluma nitroreducens]|uniref:Transcriptional regulator, AraC family n=1 Tax=Aquipluma nitroreducens TaxID=2010828 RepID=A0A5K7SDU2_9BACT|nr:helix-turn-helix domain-containing protein [Aquipluma nitroreducens]BBE19659.1 transcriptional regulator, AraC family [Aquipluma nitroreducens]
MIPEPGNTDLNLVDFVILLGVVQGIMLTITSLFRKGRKEKFKAAMFFFLTGIIAEIFMNRTGYMYFVIPLVDFSEPFQFALPPLIYLLVLSIDPDVVIRKWELHFIPFIAYTLFFLPFYLAPYEYKFENYYYVHHMVEWKTTGHYEMLHVLGNIRRFQMFFWYFQTIIYLVLSFQKLAHFYQNPKPGLWQIEIKWWFAFSVIISVLIVVTLVVKMTYFRDFGDHIIASFLTVIIYCSTLTELLRPTVLHQVVSEIEELPKIATSGIKEEKKTEIQQKLLALMEEKKLYTDSLISVGKLSKLIGEPSYIISQVINEKMEASFYDWIAQYRVEEAKQLLTNPKTRQYTVEQIAEEVGYNSKSAFNKAFKKFTGQTPSEFRTNSTPEN